MKLTGCCFALDVPPAWRMETNDGVVIAASDESFAGFTPNVVLRESRLTRPELTSLAAASQANLAVLSTQLPGSFFFHVEALPDANAAPGPAERRRLWAFSTLKIPEAHGNALCLLMIQDLLVVDDVITAGTAIRESMEIIQANGATLAGVLISLDRQERGRGEISAIQEVERDYGCQVISIITLKELIAYLEEKPEMAEYLASVRAYREAYGV